MCNQPNCLHKSHVPVSDRDLRIGKAFAATLLMRINVATLDAREAQAWSLRAGACAVSCDDPECGVTKVIKEAMQHAIDHVDNGTELPVEAMYDDLNLIRQRPNSFIADIVEALTQGPIEPPVIDTVAIDVARPMSIEVTPSAQVELGRMVGADRGRMDVYGDKKLSN